VTTFDVILNGLLYPEVVRSIDEPLLVLRIANYTVDTQITITSLVLFNDHKGYLNMQVRFDYCLPSLARPISCPVCLACFVFSLMNNNHG
jgi:hypothetical protein